MSGNKSIEEYFNLDEFINQVKVDLTQQIEKSPIMDSNLATYYGDAVALFEVDPSATSLGDLIEYSVSLEAVWAYRLAHQYWLMDEKHLAMRISYLSKKSTGVEIHPRAVIDELFAIDHGSGTVIGEDAVIGKNVVLYQGVTLGARRPHDAKNRYKGDLPEKRHPTLEDNVVVYAGAKILGPITIPKGTIIGANKVVSSLPV
jgi:serine O-acetyltransferase